MMIMFPPEKMCNSPSATVVEDSELDKTSDCCFVLLAMGAGEGFTGGEPNSIFVKKGFFRDHIGPFLDTQNMFYTWSHPQMSLQKLLM